MSLTFQIIGNTISVKSGTSHRRRSRSTLPTSARPSTAWCRRGRRYRASAGQTCAATLPPPSRPPACGRCSRPPTSSLDEVWSRLLAPADQRIRHGLSRFARWASLRRIAPEAVDDGTIDRFIAELDAATLVRNLREPAPHRREAWNALVELHAGAGLRPVAVPTNRPCADPNSLAAASSLVPGGCRAIPHLGVRAGPARRGGAGKGPRAAEPAPAANAHPFRRECGGCGRHPARSNYLSGEPCRTRDLPRPPAPSLARGRMQAVRLHAWCCRHADRDCFGMGEGARGYNCDPQGPSEQARNAADPA